MKDTLGAVLTFGTLYRRITPVQNFPRLRTIFGVPVGELSAANIAVAIEQGVPEAADLDWKSELYEPTNEGNREFAKDVAAMANGVGGILVLGVKATDTGATEASLVEITKTNTERFEQICRDRIHPFLPGVAVLPLEVSDGKGYYAIVVDRSADAPHAVVVGGNSPALRYAVRAGTTTRYLHEAEVAARYRDRFASRAERAAALDKVHRDGLARLPSADAWIAVSAYPTILGSLGVGSSAVSKVEGFVITWMRYQSPPVSSFQEYRRTVPGLRRAIINPEVGYIAEGSTPHAQLHFDGAGFVALPITRVLPDAATDERAPAELDQNDLELRILAAVSMLAQHAVNTSCGGDLTLRAQLVLSTRPSHLDMELTPTFISEVSASAEEIQEIAARPPCAAVVMRKSPSVIEIAADVNEVGTDRRATVITAHAITCDILGEFGIADPRLLRPDGGLDTENLATGLRAAVAAWCGLVD
ncbi:AlbA family DNA-binding domain-containing protein [Nocardia jiangsuensis]|uniref:Helix-turn-helix domain-containing protein n=1 Tax=Nocardia jiangsuensis TaxID=1691563 RepID=A0ABV8DSQ1_9NOCA